MYASIADILPHLNDLQTALIPEMDHQKYASTIYELDLLPYTLMAAQSAFASCILAQEKILKEYDQKCKDHKAIYGLSQDERDYLSFPMDSFLETARRCQNALVPYLSKSLGISLKQSLSDVIKDIQNGKVDLGAVINDLLCGYWETYGKKLKSYRDRSQHFANVVSDARVFWSDEGKVSLYLLLPNNPEVNDPSKWEYENPHTHAYLYAKNQLHKLIVTVYCITRFLGDKVLKRPTSDTTKQFTLRPVQLRAPITLGEGARNEGIRLLTEHDMKYEFTTTLQKCHQMYEAHIGPSLK